MKKIYLMVIFGFTLILGGCGDLSKLKEVKSIGIVGISLDKDIDSHNPDVLIEIEKSKKDLRSIESSAGIVTPNSISFSNCSMDPTLQVFFTELMNDVVKEIAHQGIQVKLAPEFKDNPILNEMKKDKGIFAYQFVNPDFYASGIQTPDKEKIKQLAKDINVDAIAYLHFKILRKFQNISSSVPTEKLGLDIRIKLIHKDGTSIINYSSFVVFSDQKLDSNEELVYITNLFVTGNNTTIRRLIKIDRDVESNLFSDLRVNVKKFFKEKLEEGRK